ncbi:MAG: hypothetical protein ACK4QL_01065 [Pseudanabaenaceae cyanobacterium]
MELKEAGENQIVAITATAKDARLKSYSALVKPAHRLDSHLRKSTGGHTSWHTHLRSGIGRNLGKAVPPLTPIALGLC